MAAVLRFCGGGSLDGAELELPPDLASAVTIDRSGRSWYALGGTGPGNVFVFCGHDETGEVMTGFMREFSAAAKAERDAIAEAQRPVGCRACGATYGSQGAYVVHFESGEGSRCLPDDARGQLVDVSGVWCIPNTDVARR
jgi:hypothetical protein